MTIQEQAYVMVEGFLPYVKDWYWYNGDKAKGGLTYNATLCALKHVEGLIELWTEAGYLDDGEVACFKRHRVKLTELTALRDELKNRVK